MIRKNIETTKSNRPSKISWDKHNIVGGRGGIPTNVRLSATLLGRLIHKMTIELH